MQLDSIKFEKRDVKNFLLRELKLDEKLSESFDYLVEKLKPKKSKNLSKIKWYETKNYEWCCITDNDVTIIIRKYQQHFTFYCRKMKHHYLKDKFMYSDSHLSIFTLYSDLDNMTDEEQEKFEDNDFVDVDELLPKIFEHAEKNTIHSIWNTYSFVRPKWVDVLVVSYKEEITNIDKFIFGCEELFQLHFEFFAENEVFEKIKTLNVGDNFGKDFHGNVTIKRINIEFSKSYGDNYFHVIGIETINTEGETKFEDVYSLGRWHHEKLFPKD